MKPKFDLGLLAILTVALTSSATSGRELNLALATHSVAAGNTAATGTTAAHQGSRRLEGVLAHVEAGWIVRGHHVGPVAVVVAPGAGHLRGSLGRHGHATTGTAVRSVIVMTVGRVGRAAVAPLAVHGRRWDAGGGCGGHVDGWCGWAAADDAAVGRGHDSRGGGRARRRDVVADTLLRGLVGQQQLRAAVAGRWAAVLDALALDTHGGALEVLAVELGDGGLGHVGLSELDKGHGADVARVRGRVGAGVDIAGSLDQVDL